MRRAPSVPGQPSRSYLDRVRWVEVTNAGGEDAPGGALLMVTGGGEDDGDEADDFGVPTVGKPDADGLPGLLVAHPSGIPAGGRGLATPSDFVPVAYDDAETPAVGDTWGSAADSWLLTKDKAGWRVGAPPVASQDLKLVECWRAACCDDSGSSGSGNRITVLTGLCENTSGSGPALVVRMAILDLDAGTVTDEWCEAIGECGSGTNGGLCDDLPDLGVNPPDDPDVPTVETPCGTYPETMCATVSLVECGGDFSVPIAYDPENHDWTGQQGFGFACCPGWPDEPFEIQLVCVSGTTWSAFAGSPNQSLTDEVFTVLSTDPFEATLTGTYGCAAFGGEEDPGYQPAVTRDIVITFTEVCP